VHAFGNKVNFSVKCAVIGEMVDLIICMQTKYRTYSNTIITKYCPFYIFSVICI